MISSPPPYYNFKKIPAVLERPYDFGNPLPYIGLEADPGADRGDAAIHHRPRARALEGRRP